MVEVSSGICLEEISIQSLFGRQLAFTDCLVASFSSDILGSNCIFKYFLVECFLGRFFHQMYFGEVSFENCFVEISPQRVCGRNVFFQNFFGRGFCWNLFGIDFFREFLL